MHLGILSLTLWTWMTFLHPFFITLTELRFNPSSKKMEVAQKIFWDDLEVGLSKEIGGPVDFLNPKDKSKLETQIKAYLLKHTQVWVNGQAVPIVGRISMDMMAIDLTDCPIVKIGDRVELWGKHIPIEVVAHQANTIAYELMTQVTQRVGKQYLE